MALIFEDNFDGTSINSSKWPNVYTNPTWWPNTSANSKNASVSNGQLHLKLSVGGEQGRNYTGTGLENLGVVDRSLGYWECKARFPQGNLGCTGYLLLWPTVGWPPEIDFAETTGNDANKITFTQHWTQDGHKTETVELSLDITQFHTYAVEITSDNKIKWYVDGILRTTQTHHSPGTKWCFAAGLWAGDCSGWGGCPKAENFPQYLDIDYVRIYDSKPTTNAVKVTSPNGGEKWTLNSTHNITWAKNNNTEPNVKIMLLKNDVIVETIASSTPNDGSFSWTIPSTQTTGTDYKIGITPRKADGTLVTSSKDISDANFTIVEPPLKWKCSGAPNYTCIQAVDGKYDTQAECVAICKPPKKFDVYIIGDSGNPSGVLTMKNIINGVYTEDEACLLVCNTLKNIN